MDEAGSKQLFEQAASVLAANDRGGYTIPAAGIYPHQWLWDSCFIAIGLRHIDAEKAQSELLSLLRGQWANGMMPNIIFNDSPKHRREHNLYQSWLNPHAPNGVITSGLTQPPMLAEAVVMVGEKLKLPERRAWYAKMYPHILHYHHWMYAQRNPRGNGLVELIHPYESGFDSSPPWIAQIRVHAWPWWLKILEKTHLDSLVDFLRKDTRYVPKDQRASIAVEIAYIALLRHLRHQAYDSETILKRPKIAVEDLAFNCILIRANHRLLQISKTIGEVIPEDLRRQMKQTEESLEHLWDEGTGQYYSYNFNDGGLIREPSIMTLLPLYAGCVSKERAEHLVSLLKKRSQFKANWPVPSVPLSNDNFNPICYWQGPSWVNTNWLIIDGLRRYGFDEEAESLRLRTIELAAKSGFSEYFDPNNAKGLGAHDFSWTAALIIDLLKH